MIKQVNFNVDLVYIETFKVPLFIHFSPFSNVRFGNRSKRLYTNIYSLSPTNKLTITSGETFKRDQ